MPDKYIVKLNNDSGYNFDIHNKDDHSDIDIRHLWSFLRKSTASLNSIEFTLKRHRANNK